jgi:putative nucleotidyltransferase with HDIG domain
MAYVERQNLGPISPFLPREPGLRAHVFRVATLAARTADLEGLAGADVETVEWAGMLHHHVVDLDGGPAAAKLLQDLGLPPCPEMNQLPRRVWQVLRVYQGLERTADAFVAQAAAWVESANLLDEQMENLPYDEAGLEASVDELLESGIIDPAFARALTSFRVLSREALLEAARRLPVISSDDAEAKLQMERAYASYGAKQLWLHALQTAEQTAAVAAEAGRLDAAEAYLAGCIHDIGRLAFAISPASEAVERWQRAGFPVTYAEYLTTGTDHAALGAEILKMWRFPEELVDAVEHHHRPELSRSRLTAALYAAEDLDESLPSCARDHTAAKRLDIEAVRRAGSAS